MKSRITITDIAKLANVSKTTVSFYLNGKHEKMSEETRLRIEKAIAKTGYEPSIVARSLNFKQTRLLGVIIGDITNSFANQIVKGIETYAKECGYQLIVGSSGYNIDHERQYVRSMSAMGVDGFIVQPTVDFESMWINSGYEKPVVFFDSPNSSNHQGLWVKTNNYEAVYEATEMLCDKGYRHFVIVTADPYVLRTRLERNRGMTDCLDLKGYKYDLLIADAATTEEEIEQKLAPIISAHEDVCVFVCNNWLLTKVYKVMQQWKHQMPHQLGLIGFDSLEWTELASPSVTTIVQPAYEEGYRAGKILIDIIEEKNEEVPNQILKCWINEKESTCKK